MPDVQWLEANDGNFTSGGNSMEYIVVHNTGNTASASQEASYAHNDQHNSSYHYVLDDDEIWQIVHEYDTAWSVGAWPGCTQYIRNNQTINIEVCSNGDPFTDAEVSNLAWLIADIRSRHDIDDDHIVRHFDCHSGHKDCPAAYVDDDAWAGLKARISNGQEEDDMTPGEVAAAVWAYRYKAEQDNMINTLFRIDENTRPNKPWEYVWSGDKTEMPDGQNPNGYNVLREVLREVRELSDKVDKLSTMAKSGKKKGGCK